MPYKKYRDVKMTKEELEKCHDDYDKNIKRWHFNHAAYKGIDALICHGAFPQHERETEINYYRRKNALYGIGLSRSIVDIFNFYLFTKEAKIDYGKLSGNEVLELFLDDSDKYGSTLENIIKTQSKNASIFGHTGILVWRAPSSASSMMDQLNMRDYAYLSTYTAPCIMDWSFEMMDGNPVLSYLKFMEGMKYRILTLDTVEIWEMNDVHPMLIDTYKNPLGVIPFVWLSNDRDSQSMIGSSDIDDIARIDVSITTNLSQGEEVIDYAAFPMMRKPKRPPGDTSEDLTGVSSILEFDINRPESKPDWLEAKVGEPIDAILKWIDFKVLQAYRSKNTSGLISTSARANSDQASAREFQMLNARLANKSEMIERAQNGIMKFWAMWHGVEWDGKIQRPKDFDIENLKMDLDNLIIANSMVASKTFKQLIQKTIAREAIDDLEPEDLAIVDSEIETQAVQTPELGNLL